MKDNSNKTSKTLESHSAVEKLNNIAKENVAARGLTAASTFSQLANQQNSLMERFNQPSYIARALTASSVFSEMTKQQNSLREKLNPLFGFQDTIKDYSRWPFKDTSNNAGLAMLMGGSTANVFAKLSYEASKPFTITNALHLINSHHYLFSKQVSIFQRFCDNLYEINKLAKPSWFEAIDSVKDYSRTSTLSVFEVLSANTLGQIIEEYPEDNDPNNLENDLDSISSLIEENKELKHEIEKLLKVISTPSKKKSLKKQLEELNDPIKQFSYYVHLKLFKNTEKWSLKTTHYFISLMSYLFVTIYLTQKLEKFFFADTASLVVNHKEVNIDNRKILNVCGFDSTSVWGVSSRDSKLYLRKSIKTDCIGMIREKTTLRVLQKKRGWLFVESAMTKFSKKTKMEMNFVSRGWIKSEDVVFE